MSTSWISERREKSLSDSDRPTGRFLQEEYTQPRFDVSIATPPQSLSLPDWHSENPSIEDNDYEEEEGNDDSLEYHTRPGAYAVSRIGATRSSQQSFLDDNNSLEFAQATGNQPIPALMEEGTLEVTPEAEQQTTQPSHGCNLSFQNWNERKLLIFMVLFILLAIIASLVYIVTSTQGENKGNSPVVTPSFHHENCQQVYDSKQSLDSTLLCNCLTMDGFWNVNLDKLYQELKRNMSVWYQFTPNFIKTSCAIENVALIWIALEIEKVNSTTLSFPRIKTRYILTSFYLQLGGNDWIKKNNWTTYVSECDWLGVQCSKNHILESLHLSDNDLKGQLKDNNLASLESLKHLNLSNNMINGTLPGDLWNNFNLGKIQYQNSHQ
jgi:hypothetical protein